MKLAQTKLFYATDVHGSDTTFRKFINSAKVYKPDLLILGGDITGKAMVPIIEQQDGSWKASFMNKEYLIKTSNELESLKKTIQFTGYYPYCTNPKEVEELTANPGKQNMVFLKLMTETLENWLKIAEERLKPLGIKCYITGGNDDPTAMEKVLDCSSYVINPAEKVVDIDNHHEMISSSKSNLTPWRCPRDVSEEELSKEIEKMASQVKNMKNCVFNLHVPPYDTDLDTAYEIDDNYKFVLRGGAPHKVPVGSVAVRKAIEKYQPLLGLHGHIHESRGSHSVGRTICVNPGSEYGEGVLRGVIVVLGDARVQGMVFTSG